MAVLASIYGQQQPEYAGCVIDTYEHNGYDDSDFYAVCWDEAKGQLVEVEYDTTRCGRGGWAKIDATEEVLRKVYRFHHRQARAVFDTVFNPKQARQARKGDAVAVVRGRKVPVGTVGKVFWIGEVYNQYTRKTEQRAGIEADGERLFVPVDFLEPISWQSRLITGKDRKARIRKAAIAEMPAYSRHYFERGGGDD